jgi:hypothetical protein
MESLQLALITVSVRVPKGVGMDTYIAIVSGDHR